MNSILRPLALCCTLLLGGCFVTKDEVFSLTGGNEIPIRSDTMRCIGYVNGKPNGKVRQSRMMKIEHSKKRFQYVDVPGTDGGKVQSFTYYHVTGDRYIAVQSFDAPDWQQVLYSATITPTTFDMFLNRGPAVDALAVKYHVALKKEKDDKDVSSQMTGTVDNQKAFIRAVVAGRVNERPYLSCAIQKPAEPPIDPAIPDDEEETKK